MVQRLKNKLKINWVVKIRNKKLFRCLIYGTILTVSFVFLWLLVFLEFICDWSQGICILSAFLIQTPATYFTLFIESIIKTKLSIMGTKIIFILITFVFWSLIGFLIGLILYKLKKKENEKNK